MEELLLNLLVLGYASVGIIATVGYVPTIKDLWIHKKMSANTSSFAIWTASSGVTFLYSLFILPDLLFRIISGLSFLSCAIILSLSISLKSRRR